MARLRREFIQPQRRWLKEHGLSGMLGSCKDGYYINATEKERAAYRAIITGTYGNRIQEIRATPYNENQAEFI